MVAVGTSSITDEGESKTALDLYVASLEVAREILSEFGRSPQALRDLSVSLNKVADMMVAVGTSSITDEGESKTALDLYVASLEVCREILSEFGRSPQALRDLSVSLNKVADMMRAVGTSSITDEGESKTALDLYVASLEVAREILSEFGRSPQALRDLSVSLDNVADMMRAVGTSSITDEGESKTALDLYVASLEVCREILSEFGRSPQALRDLSVSLNKVADMMRAVGTSSITDEGESKTALDLYVASLEVRREILSEFGRSPQALRDIFVSLTKFALMAKSDGDESEACAKLAECLEVIEDIENSGWAMAQTREDRAWVEAKMSEWKCDANRS